jgi:hypothetical protein
MESLCSAAITVLVLVAIVVVAAHLRLARFRNGGMR